MLPTVNRRWRSPNNSRSTCRAVFVQFAKERRIAEATSKAWYYASVGSPLWDVVQQAAVAARLGRRDIIEGFLQKIRAADESAVDLTAELISQTQQADLTEDQLEEVYRLHPSKETWLPLRRAKLSHIAMEQDMIAACDREYC